MNVGVFTTIFGAEPFKIKPDGMLNNSNFIKQNTKVEGNICQLLFNEYRLFQSLNNKYINN